MTIQANVPTSPTSANAGNGHQSKGHQGKGYQILQTARRQVLEDGIGLTQAQLEEILRLPDEALPAAL